MIVKRGVTRQTIVSSLLIAIAVGSQARAESRTTSFATFLHIGPGRQYAVTDEVPTGTAVDVTGCQDNWCRIRYGGGFGWVEQRMLAAEGGAANPGASAAECFAFARTGWPNSGDHERLCIQAPAGAPAR